MRVLPFKSGSVKYEYVECLISKDNLMEYRKTTVIASSREITSDIIVRVAQRFDTSLKLATKGRVNRETGLCSAACGITKGRGKGGAIFERDHSIIKDFIAGYQPV